MFTINFKIGNRRIGELKTVHGTIKTPFFMPDATRGFMRSLSIDDLDKAGVDPMVVNTYHLYLKPGMETIVKAQGINKFMNWDFPLLSDSGGYQVFSLIHKNPKMGKITDEEVIFRSPLDGSKHILSPEKSIQIQFDLGVDMMVCLDDPPPNSYSKEKIAKAVKRTLAWARRCKDEYNRQVESRKLKVENKPLIFGVIQGGKYLDLREECAKGLAEIGFDGYGFGARHIDEEGNVMDEVLEKTASFIPEDFLRFALGIGTPEDIVKCANFGWDMFDCVIPSREGRHGRLFIRKNNFSSLSDFYETININNEKYKEDFGKIDENCDCELCRNYSKAYLRHIFSMQDPLAMRLASIHNLKFYMDLMESFSE
jgi:queuine tRNA-ribosyltransferase